MKKKNDMMKMNAMINHSVIDILKTTMTQKNANLKRTNMEDEYEYRKL